MHTIILVLIIISNAVCLRDRFILKRFIVLRPGCTEDEFSVFLPQGLNNPSDYKKVLIAYQETIKQRVRHVPKNTFSSILSVKILRLYLLQSV